MSFSFQKQLRSGQIGEVLFFQAHQGTLNQEDGRKRDFSCALTGEGLELKTDMYSMDATPFFFMERYSDMEKQSPGGPWQSAGHGNKWFCYFYVNNLTYFKFETEKLVARLEEVLPKCQAREIKNKTWTTLGYKVPREWLEDLATVLSLKVSLSV